MISQPHNRPKETSTGSAESNWLHHRNLPKLMTSSGLLQITFFLWIQWWIIQENSTQIMFVSSSWLPRLSWTLRHKCSLGFPGVSSSETILARLDLRYAEGDGFRFVVHQVGLLTCLQIINFMKIQISSCSLAICLWSGALTHPKCSLKTAEFLIKQPGLRERSW